MKTIIIDDDVCSIDILADKLKAFDEVEIVGTATTGKRGIEMIAKLSPQLVFLDVELPDINGIDFLEQIDDSQCEDMRIVMYTAHPKYMLKSFRGNAFDYLLKPVDDQELKEIILRLQSAMDKESCIADTGIVKNNDEDKLLFYTNTVDFRLVHIKDIGAFQYNHDQRVWEVVISERDEPIRLKRNVSNEAILAIDNRFIQVSQRHIINKNYLMEVRDNICHLYPPFDNIENIKVGRLFRKKLIEQFTTL